MQNPNHPRAVNHPTQPHPVKHDHHNNKAQVQLAWSVAEQTCRRCMHSCSDTLELVLDPLSQPFLLLLLTLQSRAIL